MAQDRFAVCLAEVLRQEGGYVDDPRDAGGPTNLGVTLATLSRALGRPASLDELSGLTAEGAAPVYRRLYWRPAGCDRLAPGLDLMVFDTAVNMGVGAAASLLQAAVGASIDGAVGEATLAAAERADPVAATEQISAARGARYRSFAEFAVFGAGWLKRLDEVTARSLAEAPRAPGPISQQQGAAP